MLTKELIDKFYQDVNSLGLKFPVAAIAKETGYSKGNVSGYLKGKPPSENFINAFYRKFSKSLDNVPRAENAPVVSLQPQNGQKSKKSEERTNKEPLQTVTTKPNYEMQPTNGNPKDAIIKTLADTNRSQQELISELAKNVMILTGKLIEKR